MIVYIVQYSYIAQCCRNEKRFSSICSSRRRNRSTKLLVPFYADSKKVPEIFKNFRRKFLKSSYNPEISPDNFPHSFPLIAFFISLPKTLKKIYVALNNFSKNTKWTNQPQNQPDTGF